MKKLIFLSAAAVTIFASCGKTDSTTSSTDCSQLPISTSATVIESQNLKTYLVANGLNNTAIEKNGMYYIITNQGTGVSPNLCSNLTVTYKGNLINISSNTEGGVFDETLGTATATFPLSGVITGWKIIFPLVKAVGNVTLFIPPSLAYGAQAKPSRGPGYSDIPANSYLKFTVSLLSVQ
jgi:FKBP-type peptidyl-prolyl cis-trans isomerase FkpA